MSIHVLQLGPYPPPEGGVSRNMLAIRDELVKRGDKCSIIATSRSTSRNDEPDVYHPAGPAEILKLLSVLSYDIIHLHVGGELNSRVMSLAMIAALFGRKRSVLTVHSGAFPLTDEAKAAGQYSKHGITFRRFGAIIAVNDALAETFRRFGVADEKIHKILPFSLSLPDNSVAVPLDLARFISNHSPLLLSVGGLEKDYDPLFQIEAFGRTLQEFPNAGLMLVGDGALRSEVENAISRGNYTDNILVAGNIEHAVTLHLINKADILLRTTLFDGDAISVREALFLGTPVIATENGMRPEGTHLIDIGDKEGLLNCICEIVATPRTKSSWNHEGAENIDEMIKLYAKLLST